MKKTTLFARKRAHLTRVSDPRFAGLATLARCLPFNEEPAFEFMEDVRGNATEAMLMINDAMADLLNHRVEPENDRPYGLLSHAVDVGHIRTIQIDQDDQNPHHHKFLAAKAVMNRLLTHRRTYGRWALTGPDRNTLADAVDIYEGILISSSPQQMAIAIDIRKGALAKGKVWAPTSKGGAA